MKRRSFLWWLVIMPTSVIVGAATYLLVDYLTELGTLQRLAVVAISVALVDLAIAVSMEAVAPTRIIVGPGEKSTDAEAPFEKATVISGFAGSSHGQVLIRGERWRATRAPEDTGSLAAGMAVNVIDRKGLVLVVKAPPR